MADHSSAPKSEAELYAQQQREQAAQGPPPPSSAQQIAPGYAYGGAPDAGAKHVPPPPQQQQQAPPQYQGQAQYPGQSQYQGQAQYPGQSQPAGGGPQPIAGLPVRGPTSTPAAGDVILGYKVVTPQDNCSCDLKMEGWLVVLILILVFPCVACIPCCITDCFQTYQVPVYGPPGSTMSQQQDAPVAQPYQQA